MIKTISEEINRSSVVNAIQKFTYHNPYKCTYKMDDDCIKVYFERKNNTGYVNRKAEYCIKWNELTPKNIYKFMEEMFEDVIVTV